MSYDAGALVWLEAELIVALEAAKAAIEDVRDSRRRLRFGSHPCSYRSVGLGGFSGGNRPRRPAYVLPALPAR